MLGAKAWFGPGNEGFPERLHGGSAAAVLEAAMAAAAWASGFDVGPARLSVEYRAPVPPETEATALAWIEQVDGRVVITRARLAGSLGETFAEATGEFRAVSLEWLAGGAAPRSGT